MPEAQTQQTWVSNAASTFIYFKQIWKLSHRLNDQIAPTCPHHRTAAGKSDSNSITNEPLYWLRSTSPSSWINKKSRTDSTREQYAIQIVPQAHEASINADYNGRVPIPNDRFLNLAKPPPIRPKPTAPISAQQKPNQSNPKPELHSHTIASDLTTTAIHQQLRASKPVIALHNQLQALEFDRLSPTTCASITPSPPLVYCKWS